METTIAFLTLLAIVLGPVLAVIVGRNLQNRESLRERQGRVFTTLMATRASVLNPRHVEALNMIDVEFASSKRLDRNIRDHWKLYLNNLADHNFSASDNNAWQQENRNRLINLLHVMSKRLGYNVDKAQIESGAYIPVYYGKVESANNAIRLTLAEMLTTHGAVIVSNKDDAYTPSEEQSKPQQQLNGNEPEDTGDVDKVT